MQNDAKTEPGSTQGYEIGRQNKYGKEELKQYYLNMACQLCPGALPEPFEGVKLSMLYTIPYKNRESMNKLLAQIRL